MTRYRLLFVLVLATVMAPPPARAWFGTPIPSSRPLAETQAGCPGPPGIMFKKVPRELVSYGPVAPPHPSGAAVIELLEDDAGRLSTSLNPGADLAPLGKAGAWGDDCFSGACCLKVAGYQRFREQLPGWTFPVVEKPKAGEYRYLRFAWKKPEGRGVMVQLCVSGVDWGRYYSGENAVGFAPAMRVSATVPREWEVVTRDLYADFGGVPFNLTGFAFTSMDGVALFDHVYLGRTIADLDRVTTAARVWSRKTEALDATRLEGYWKELSSDDAAVRMPALWALGACGKSSVPFVSERLKTPDAAEVERRIKKAIADLDAARYAVRERAHKQLDEYGLTALPYLEEALPKVTSPEWRMRLEKLIAKCRANEGLLTTTDQRMTLRTIRILELADTADAKAQLGRLAAGMLEAGLSDEAKAALERMAKRQ
jgi:hypothetical protein